MKVGFGIIGCGSISGWHASAIKKCAEAVLVGASDISQGSAEIFCNKYSTRYFKTTDELLNCQDINVVCICTPSGLHAQTAIMAAKAGKHVLIEKPMVLNLADADAIILAAAQNHVKIGVVSQWRFTETVNIFKEMVSTGRLGKITIANIFMNYNRSNEYYYSNKWRGTKAMDGGVLMNQGIHGVDILQYIMGPVKQVFGMACTLSHNIETDDTVSAVLEFACGAIGVIQGATSVFPGSPRKLCIFGTMGTITLTEDVFTEWELKDGTACIGKQGCQKFISGYNDPTNISFLGHELHIADMVNAVSFDHRPFVDCIEGRIPIQIISSIYESARLNKPISL